MERIRGYAKIYSTFITGSQANDLRVVDAALRGRKGIYVLVPQDSSPNGLNASGHVDVLNENMQFASNKSYLSATGGVKEIYLFILPN